MTIEVLPCQGCGREIGTGHARRCPVARSIWVKMLTEILGPQGYRVGTEPPDLLAVTREIARSSSL